MIGYLYGGAGDWWTPKTWNDTKNPYKLTDKQILEAFPVECKELKNDPEVVSYYRTIENLKTMRYKNEFSRIFKLLCLEIVMKPKVKLKFKEACEQMLLVMNGAQDNKPLTPEDIERAKKVSIKGLYSFTKVKQVGNKFSACCPFGHKDNTPSFVVYENNQYHCFSCQEHGSSIDFIMKMENLSFVDAVKLLKAKTC